MKASVDPNTTLEEIVQGHNYIALQVLRGQYPQDWLIIGQELPIEEMATEITSVGFRCLYWNNTTFVGEVRGRLRCNSYMENPQYHWMPLNTLHWNRMPVCVPLPRTKQEQTQRTINPPKNIKIKYMVEFMNFG